VGIQKGASYQGMLKSYSKRGKNQVESTLSKNSVFLCFCVWNAFELEQIAPYSKPLNGYRNSESNLMAAPPTSMAIAKFAAVMTAAVFHPKSLAIIATVDRHGM